MRAIRPGKPYPRGATWDGQGVNFALFSEYATDAWELYSIWNGERFGGSVQHL